MFQMKNRRFIVLLLTILLSALLTLSSCGGKKIAVSEAEPAPSAAVPEEAPSSEFIAHAPINETAISDAASWAQSELARIDSEMAARTEEEDFSLYSSVFNAANSFYKSGELSVAEEQYAAILAQCPTHLGARNNYVLALAYQGKYEESLKNSILLGLIHPDYQGNWVNIQIPLYALGYDRIHYSSELKASGFPDVSQLDLNTFGENFSDYPTAAYTYNFIYSEIESQLDDRDAAPYLAKLEEILIALKNQDPADPDYTGLLAYFKAIQHIRMKNE